MSEKLSQVEASRIMYAAEKYAGAAVTNFVLAKEGTKKQSDAAHAHYTETKQAFADLIASLTDSEGL